MSLVDVAIPCYCYGRFLRQCVESVLAQNLPVRVLIVDDCSPDDSGDIAASLGRENSRIEVRRHLTNQGHIGTYNECLDWASARYTLLLSADDYLLPGGLRRATSLLDSRSDIGFVFGYALEMSPDGRKWTLDPFARGEQPAVETVFTPREFILRSHARNLVPTATAVVRTSVQKELGGYRDDLPHSADMEMWWRFASVGSVGFVPEALAVYRRHGSNMSESYAVSHMLPDLQQRRAAIDVVFDRGNTGSLEAGWRGDIMTELSADAVEQAARAFDAGDLDSMRQLLAFAVETSPRVRQSWPWAKMAAKRAVGRRIWYMARRRYRAGSRVAANT